MAYLTNQQNFVDHCLQTYQEAFYFFFLQKKKINKNVLLQLISFECFCIAVFVKNAFRPMEFFFLHYPEWPLGKMRSVPNQLVLHIGNVVEGDFYIKVASGIGRTETRGERLPTMAVIHWHPSLSSNIFHQHLLTHCNTNDTYWHLWIVAQPNDLC